jgi:hypothetical protein
MLKSRMPKSPDRDGPKKQSQLEVWLTRQSQVPAPSKRTKKAKCRGGESVVTEARRAKAAVSDSPVGGLCSSAERIP